MFNKSFVVVLFEVTFMFHVFLAAPSVEYTSRALSGYFVCAQKLELLSANSVRLGAVFSFFYSSLITHFSLKYLSEVLRRIFCKNFKYGGIA